MAKLKWTVEIEVDETWIADGFNLTDDRMHDIMMHALPWSYGHETACRVIGAPNAGDIAKLQGARTFKVVRVDDRAAYGRGFVFVEGRIPAPVGAPLMIGREPDELVIEPGDEIVKLEHRETHDKSVKANSFVWPVNRPMPRWAKGVL